MRPAALALGMTLVLAVPATAQQVADVPGQLTLEEAIEIARRNNPQHLQRVNDADVAAAQVRQNWGAFLPSLSASTGASSNWSRSLSAFGDFGEPLEQPEPITSETSGASYGLSTSLVLFDGGRMFANLSAARAGERVAEAEIANGFNTLRATVARFYFAAVRADRLASLERQLLAFGQEQVQITEEQFRIAAAQQTDVLGAQGDLAAKRRSLQAAEADARKARLDLLEQLGIRGEALFELMTDVRPVVDPGTLDTDALVARAVSSSPAVVAAEARARQADKAASASHGSRWPRISMSGGYSRGSSRAGLFDAWGRFDHSNQSANLSLSVSLPLFQGFQTTTAIAQAEAAADDARQGERQARIQAEKNVRAALIDLETAYAALQLAEEQARLTGLRLELAQEQYRAGASNMSFTNLQLIVQSNESAQRQALEARFGYQTALISLEERLGTPLQGND
jgi:outer membrane protein